MLHDCRRTQYNEARLIKETRRQGHRPTVDLRDRSISILKDRKYVDTQRQEVRSDRAGHARSIEALDQYLPRVSSARTIPSDMEDRARQDRRRTRPSSST
ncbi:MAG: hypothetical protein MZU97_13650 [Bacillus subtilis]|nr:hypothetical protein [Bacillus subtilis]